MPTTHRINCARLRPHAKDALPFPCSCGSAPNVHNHGTEDGPGLACREYLTPEGHLRGSCLDDAELAKAQELYVGKMASPNLPAGNGVTDDTAALQRGARIYEVGDDSLPVVPPVASDKWDASRGETRTTSVTGGHKGVKEARFDLIPSEALTQLAEHYAVGAEKYGDHNWRKGFEWSKSYAALNRHLHAFWSGQDLDPETGKPHLTAVAFHAFALLTFAQEHPEFDDRFRKETQ